jgi:DNA double-strand break repair helicase HerA and related ATPase
MGGTRDIVSGITAGYSFTGATVDLGALVVAGDPVPSAQIRVPLAMLNRHGLVSGATGTGKTKTLQSMAEQLSGNGVPVFLADIKGDLSGLATAGEPDDRLTARASAIGQDWRPTAYPVEFYALGGEGTGIPVRATVTSFGPTLLAKVLGLNATQESSLGLVFMFADTQGLPLLDLKDLRAVIQHLTGEEGKQALAALGGLSKQTAGVILRDLLTLEGQGAEVFFGEPAFDPADLLRTAPDGRGVISCLELPALQDRPQLFSTFLMWLLAELFEDLPEVGDPGKPRLVFFFDEAHLLFSGASKAFLQSITQTVRLIRSKGVGVFFVTQTPKDVPADVLAQLGSRVQHALRAFTPDDAKALKATVSTFPKSSYDLEEVLTRLGIGEAVVTALSDEGVPTPVAWTRLRAPQSRMAPAAATVVQQAVTSSPLYGTYAQPIDRRSAYEMLSAKIAPPAPEPAPQPARPASRQAPRPAPPEPDLVGRVLGSPAARSFARSMASALGREITRGIFGTAKRRRR